MIKCSNVYKVQSDCRIKLERSPYSEGVFHRGDLITILEMKSHVLAYVIINETFFYIKLEELSNLIDKGFICLENQTISTSDNETLSKIKYRIVYALRSLLNRNENQAIIEQLAKWEIDPRKFNVSIYGNIDLKDHGDYEKAIHLIADKIVGE